MQGCLTNEFGLWYQSSPVFNLWKIKSQSLSEIWKIICSVAYYQLLEIEKFSFNYLTIFLSYFVHRQKKNKTKNYFRYDTFFVLHRSTCWQRMVSILCPLGNGLSILPLLHSAACWKLYLNPAENDKALKRLERQLASFLQDVRLCVICQARR